MVAADLGEVVLQHGQGAGQRHMAAAAEQSHAGEAEDGGHQGGIRHPTQTLDAALEASCRGRQKAQDQYFENAANGVAQHASSASVPHTEDSKFQRIDKRTTPLPVSDVERVRFEFIC